MPISLPPDAYSRSIVIIWYFIAFPPCCYYLFIIDSRTAAKRTFAIRFRYLLMNAGVSRTAFKLAVVQLRIEAALSHQCIMIALLNDISVLHDQNQISIPDC